MEKVNIVLGRFQPFTLGHLSCVDDIYRVKGLRSVIVMIYTPDSKTDMRHPFPSSFLLDIYKRAFGEMEDRIADIVTAKNANIIDIADTLRKKGYEIGCWSCGTDRIKDYTRISRGYGEKAGLADDFEMFEVKRGDDDVSATAVRDALRRGDRDAYKKMEPKSMWPFFDRLREQILTIHESSKEQDDVCEINNNNDYYCVSLINYLKK